VQLAFSKRYLGFLEQLAIMAAKEKKIAIRSRPLSSQATDNSEPPLKEEFVAETIQAIAELDSGMGKTFSSKKEFLEDLERH
jgi:hypothetical protein